jgi:asparagine N-glycosylation enzyme membrane subunit Stt3
LKNPQIASLHLALKIPSLASTEGEIMLWTIAVLLLILWLLGMVSSYTLGGFIHILLVLAIVAVLIRLIQGRNPVA